MRHLAATEAQQRHEGMGRTGRAQQEPESKSWCSQPKRLEVMSGGKDDVANLDANRAERLTNDSSDTDLGNDQRLACQYGERRYTTRPAG